MRKTIQFIKSKMPFMPLQVLHATSAKELKQIKDDLERIRSGRPSRFSKTFKDSQNKMGKAKILVSKKKKNYNEC